MDLKEDVLKAYFNAVFNCSYYFDNKALEDFKSMYPKEYKVLNAFYRARTNIRESVEVMSIFGVVQWFTLTFDNDKDKNKETTKRKMAQRFLNGVFSCYLLVEEYGEENGRYHLHGFGIYKEGKGFNDFISWDYRNKIESLTEGKIKKKIKYLTNYSAKSLPRIRRSKTLVYLLKRHKKEKCMKNGFNTCYNCAMRLAYIRIQLYNEGSNGNTK